MATKIPQPIKHVYKEINAGKYATVRHYELALTTNGNSLLSDKINIQKDRNFAKSMPDYWLKIRKGNKWTRPITGLFKTEKKNLFYGDRFKKRDMILVKFSEIHDEVTIYIFQNFYTRHISILAPLTVK
ncbi:MAG: hypothetical protein ABGW97_07250 [Christiangramia sp.]|uniref:hypothetical protein n=1 Tax=Christiangramia sp. TaxID=1931228 RepID=UPI0032425E69